MARIVCRRCGVLEASSKPHRRMVSCMKSVPKSSAVCSSQCLRARKTLLSVSVESMPRIGPNVCNPDTKLWNRNGGSDAVSERSSGGFWESRVIETYSHSSLALVHRSHSGFDSSHYAGQ
jgi:hypothetical protein